MSKKEKRNVEDEFDIFDIDLTRLDKEWVNQPKLFFSYASKLAKAHKRESEARGAREVVKADVGLMIRKKPEKYGITVKVTEALITGAIIKHPKYVKAQKKRLAKKYKTDLLQAAVTALNHRKSALERLVSLHGQNYFATPTAKDGTQEQAEELKKKAARTKNRRKKK